MESIRSFDGDRDEVLVEMARTFGRHLDRWWRQREKRANYFVEDGTGCTGDKKASEEVVQTRLRVLIRSALGGLEAQDIAAFEWILLRISRLEPSKRMLAKEVAKLLLSARGQRSLRPKKLGYI